MKKIATGLALALSMILLFPAGLGAQDQKTPEEKEKEMRERIDERIERLTDLLDLDPGQEFYVDSILTRGYGEMSKEIEALNKAKVSNSDYYYAVQDKWMEAIYQGFEKVLDPEQWEKYLKNGAARDKKSRDKRMEKRKQ